MSSDPTVRETMAVVAAALSEVSHTDLETLTAAACQAMEKVDFASVTLVRADGAIETLAPTDDLALEADRLQYRLREGPCYDAATDDAMFIAEDLAHDARWPQYAPQAAALGIGAQMGLDLQAPHGERAALNLYSLDPQPFLDDVPVAEVFAAQAALMLGFTNTLDQMSYALESRKTIGQALGIVMERYQIDEERAFAFLVRVSRDSNVKLRAVAADIVAGHNSRYPSAGRDEQASLQPASGDHGPMV